MVENQTVFKILGMRAVVLIKRWCECNVEPPIEEWIFKEDEECKCGVKRHHYHCGVCGGITQTG